MSATSRESLLKKFAWMSETRVANTAQIFILSDDFFRQSKDSLSQMYLRDDSKSFGLRL
jgi:hypothetical protein